jgi:hypothetical protein
MKKTIALLLTAAGCCAALPVQVEIFEGLPAGKELDPAGKAPTAAYSEPAFAFVHTPTKFSPSAVPLDRSTPFVLRATFERTLAAGEYSFRLRARGAAAFEVDGSRIATTKAQKPNTSGDDPVPPEVVRDGTPLRPLAYPHQDSVARLNLEAGVHRFTLVAVIGGKGLYPTPGELCVSFGKPGELERLLGPDGSPPLTDEAWDAYAASSEARHRAADIESRHAAGAEVAASWRTRHKSVKEYVNAQPAIPAPRVSASMPVLNDIDRFLGVRLEEAKVAPTELTSDLEYLRRVTLDTTGQIPTPEEIRSFLAQPAKERRALALKRLLASPGWADHWVSYWQDVLAENPGILKPDLNNTGPFRWWLLQSFQDNIPFDRFVAELVAMEGSVVRGGPAGFAQATLNDAPMAAKADIVSQAFLGQKMSCARCHDAPFHPFKQKDLFGLAAMLNGKPMTLPATSTVPSIPGGRKPAVTVALKAGEAIPPEWPFKNLLDHDESGPLPGTGAPSRREVAAFIISPRNERFPQVIANRVWKRYMGLGIVEPADDWARSNPSHPELLKYLGREFVASGYDLKHLAGLILSSHAYQRKPVAKLAEQTGAKGRLFAGPARRGLTAEQIVDSLHLAAGKTFDCESLNLNPAGDRSASQFLEMGRPARSWQMTALSNERDRPALALPIAQSVADMLTAYGWRQSRQNPATTRDDAPSPMQSLILANGVLGTRIVRLSDDSAFTALALDGRTLKNLIEETSMRILSRPPTTEESRAFIALLEPHFASRRVEGAEAVNNARKSDSRVSWSNHLSAEATLIRMEEERRLRLGDQPTKRLKPEFRERYEDVLWAMVNTPEFVMMP